MVALACVWGVSCDAAKLHPIRSPQELAPGVQRIGLISDPRITESSGVVVSRTYTNVFWTHNDGPKSYTLFGITRGGQTIASFHVAGIMLHDWEDIAIDNEHHLYIGDIGNNDARRFSIAVYEIDEPDPRAIAMFKQPVATSSSTPVPAVRLPEQSVSGSTRKTRVQQTRSKNQKSTADKGPSGQPEDPAPSSASEPMQE